VVIRVEKSILKEVSDGISCDRFDENSVVARGRSMLRTVFHQLVDMNISKCDFIFFLLLAIRHTLVLRLL
jgi:hypothetical protein